MTETDVFNSTAALPNEVLSVWTNLTEEKIVEKH